MKPRLAFLQAVRNDPVSFMEAAFTEMHPGGAFDRNWHHRALFHQLNRVDQRETRRLVVNMPPRSLKSFSISVAWVAYLLGRNPCQKIMVISYGEDIALKLARQSRDLMSSTFYREVFPRTRLKRSASSNLETTLGGERYSSTNGGVITGLGGDIIILDDPQKPEDAKSKAKRKATQHWYGNTLSSRLNSQRNGAIVVVQQRLHEDDLSGFLLRSGDWSHLCLPALATTDQTYEVDYGQFVRRKAGQPLQEEREPLEVIEQQRRVMGTFDYEAQYQQAPVPEHGNLIQPSWFKRYIDAPAAGLGARVIQSWDLSFGDGGDYCACITALVDRHNVWITDVFRKKLNYPGQKREFGRLANRHRPHVILVERAANGQALIDDLRSTISPGIPSPVGITPKGSKLERMSLISARVEAGDVFLPERAPWLDDFLHEIAAFPHGAHDDQADAFSQLLSRDTSDPEEPIVGGFEIH